MVLWEFTKHLFSWVRNLKNANRERKIQSIKALRKVILAIRNTSNYLAQVTDFAYKDFSKEYELSLLWTELGFELKDLGITELASKCYMKGKYWSDVRKYEIEYQDKTDLKLNTIEELAEKILTEIDAMK